MSAIRSFVTRVHSIRFMSGRGEAQVKRLAKPDVY